MNVSEERKQEILACRDYISVTNYISKVGCNIYHVVVDEEIPISLTCDEIGAYADGWNYCFGGRVYIVSHSSNAITYEVVIYTD